MMRRVSSTSGRRRKEGKIVAQLLVVTGFQIGRPGAGLLWLKHVTEVSLRLVALSAPSDGLSVVVMLSRSEEDKEVVDGLRSPDNACGEGCATAMDQAKKKAQTTKIEDIGFFDYRPRDVSTNIQVDLENENTKKASQTKKIHAGTFIYPQRANLTSQNSHTSYHRVFPLSRII